MYLKFKGGMGVFLRSNPENVLTIIIIFLFFSEKYPELKRLMGHDTTIVWIMFCMVVTQILTAWCLKNESWMTICVVAYCFGGVVNHGMSLAIHEVGHNLAFGHGRLMWNRIVGFMGNVIIGVPISISFRRYHQDHHRYQVRTELL